MNTLEHYKSAAKEFSKNMGHFDNVVEVAIFASVAGNDEYPSDIDIALFLNSFDNMSELARQKRISNAKLYAFDIFVFDEKRNFYGNLCNRKKCPTKDALKCLRPKCGEIAYIEKREGLEFDPIRWFKTPVNILYHKNTNSILLGWQKEILTTLGRLRPLEYPKKESLFIQCRDCGHEFELNPGEQKYFESMNFHYPKRCQPCRDERYL